MNEQDWEKTKQEVDKLEEVLSVNENVSSPKEVLTEVTSVHKEEVKTGQKIELPNPEELAARASASYYQSWYAFGSLFKQLSSKEKTRVAIAVLALPEDGVPVKLKTKEEKACFFYGQKAKLDQFTVLQHFIYKQAKENKEKDLA